MPAYLAFAEFDAKMAVAVRYGEAFAPDVAQRLTARLGFYYTRGGLGEPA